MLADLWLSSEIVRCEQLRFLSVVWVPCRQKLRKETTLNSPCCERQFVTNLSRCKGNVCLPDRANKFQQQTLGGKFLEQSFAIIVRQEPYLRDLIFLGSFKKLKQALRFFLENKRGTFNFRFCRSIAGKELSDRMHEKSSLFRRECGLALGASQCSPLK